MAFTPSVRPAAAGSPAPDPRVALLPDVPGVPGIATYPWNGQQPQPQDPPAPCESTGDVDGDLQSHIPELTGAARRAATPPPPISGGTVLMTRDGSLLVAADPDRDQLYFVDLETEKLLHARALRAGDEPGRLVEDAAGRIHVVLRAGRSIATLTREPQSAIARREVCAVPRGIAYDAAHDQLHVACAEGRLVSLGAAPDAKVSRVVDVGSDARDVIVHGDRLYVSYFRSASLREIGAGGELGEAHEPRAFARTEMSYIILDRENHRTLDANSCNSTMGAAQGIVQRVESRPGVAWRIIEVPNHGVAMLHQRSRTNEVQASGGGYGFGSCGTSIVRSSLTIGLDQADTVSTDLGALTLAVDVASDPKGKTLAVAAPGNYGRRPQLTLVQMASVLDVKQPELTPQSAPEYNEHVAGCELTDASLPQPSGQITALAFVSSSKLAVLQREPAAILLYDLPGKSLEVQIDLQQPSRVDAGHSLFHARAGAGAACASCHPEAGDDGHVWNFHQPSNVSRPEREIGPRRTPDLRGGILGTEPFHWDGDLEDFHGLMSEVFMGRMAGFELQPDQTDALAQWLDKQPALHADAEDPLAAERGKQLFESADVGCAQCHTSLRGGPISESQDVGTGKAFQVPRLKGLRFRAPLMHNGCAPTLQARLTDAACGGGDKHGHTSQLTDSQRSDLIAYLKTL